MEIENSFIIYYSLLLLLLLILNYLFIHENHENKNLATFIMWKERINYKWEWPMTLYEY